MTGRWRALLVGSALAAPIGWLLAWPELVGLAVAGIVVSVAAALWWGRRPRADVAVEWTPQFVPRGADVAVPVRLEWTTPPRRGWASALARGEQRVWLPTAPGRHEVAWPVDTRTRGTRLVGPDRLDYGDPLGLVSYRLADLDPAATTVTPRIVATPLAHRHRAPADDVEGVRVGHENFHTLREWVFGDEPRKIHWRSSARAQKLLVRVSVDAAEEQTCVVLDVDAAAYGKPGTVVHVLDEPLFEAAVDMAHSLALATSGPGRVAHVLTTAAGARSASVDATHRDAGAALLAHVEPVSGPAAAGNDVSVLLRRAAVREVVVVTGRPQPALRAAIAQWRRLAQDVQLVTVDEATP